MFKKIPELLRPASILFLVVVLLSAAAISISSMYMNDAGAEEQSAKRAMRIWKSKIDGSLESDRIVDKYERSYLDLVKKGIIGDENRLSWFETIQYVSEARGMPSVRYSVASQKKHQSDKVKAGFAGLDLYASVMTLDIKMGHEGDLFALIGAMQDKAKGLFAIDKCTLDKLESSADKNKAISLDGMKAFCELSWYTIKSSSPAGG